MPPVLEVKNLTKTYGSTVAVDGVSFAVRSGEIVGFLGPNGAGKTTTISMILGLLEPSGGTITVFGKDLGAHRSDIVSRMNFTASFSWLPGNLSVWENLYVFGLLYGVRNISVRIDAVLHALNLEQFTRKKTGVLSSGEQSRLALAKALLNDPEVLLLDEPTASLDPHHAREVRQIIRDHVEQRRTAVLWTSHNMQEIAEVCDRVLFLSRGKMLMEGNPKTLPQEHGVENLEALFIRVANEELDNHR